MVKSSITVYALLGACWLLTQAFTPAFAQLTEKSLKNCRYTVPGDFGGGHDTTMLVKNGKAKSGVATLEVVAVATGDLNGDKQADGASIFGIYSGGSGFFMAVEAFTNNKGVPHFAAYRTLGDRTEVESIKISNGSIVLDLMSHGPDDASASPSVHQIVKYKLVKHRLVGPDAG